MRITLYQVDAFADRVFSGNPAAVCVLNEWLPDELMQNIAMENNLAETAFVVPRENQWHIRWFTPATEVDLCGHATLASAFVLFHYYNHPGNQIDFHSPRSGALPVARAGQKLTLDFPSDTLTEIAVTPDMTNCFHVVPQKAFKGRSDFMMVFDRAEAIRQLQPDMTAIEKLPSRGLIATAPGDDVDFVSRFFAPQVGVPEDPVTGSAHTSLTPYWAGRLGKSQLTARQLSKRGGYLWLEHRGNRISISGEARPYLEGSIEVTT